MPFCIWFSGGAYVALLVIMTYLHQLDGDKYKLAEANLTSRLITMWSLGVPLHVVQFFFLGEKALTLDLLLSPHHPWTSHCLSGPRLGTRLLVAIYKC